VPPLVGEAVALEVRAFLDTKTSRKPQTKKHRQSGAHVSDDLIPQSQAEASVRLQQIANLDRRQLRTWEKAVFLRGWFALFYLFPGLHPDNALDHGDPDLLWRRLGLRLFLGAKDRIGNSGMRNMRERLFRVAKTGRTRSIVRRSKSATPSAQRRNENRRPLPEVCPLE